MDYNHEDRLSSLPDELIFQILSCIDTKYVVQTCLISSRWNLLWTSMSCLSFSTLHFASLRKFSRFVTYVLSRRNHQIKVSSVKLNLQGAASPVFMNLISKYAFSHNLQELSVSSLMSNHHEFLNNLYNNPLRNKSHFTSRFFAPCHTPKTPWDFPALTTLHLSHVKLCDRNTGKSVDIFSKCVNLKKITLKTFDIAATEVFNIITPQLSDLTLIDGTCSDVINVIAPQLDHLTIIDCSVKDLNVSPGLSSLCYKGCHPTWLSKHRFHALNKVTINLSICCLNMKYKKEDALETVKTLQALHCSRYFKLNTDILECISSFPDLLSHVPSSFSNLICLTIDSDKRRDACKVKMATEVTNFLLGNSPSATLLKEPPTKLMIEREVREDNMTAQVASIDDHVPKLQASLQRQDITSRRQIIDKGQGALKNLMAELQVSKKPKAGLIAQIDTYLEDMQNAVRQSYEDAEALRSTMVLLTSLLEKLPIDMQAGYSRHFHLEQVACFLIVNNTLYLHKTVNDSEFMVSELTF